MHPPDQTVCRSQIQRFCRWLWMMTPAGLIGPTNGWSASSVLRTRCSSIWQHRSYTQWLIVHVRVIQVVTVVPEKLFFVFWLFIHHRKLWFRVDPCREAHSPTASGGIQSVQWSTRLTSLVHVEKPQGENWKLIRDYMQKSKHLKQTRRPWQFPQLSRYAKRSFTSETWKRRSQGRSRSYFKKA